KQASAAGGELVALLGNHEIMNAELDFRYVTEGALASFADAADAGITGLDRVPPSARGRAAAFRPGGAYAEIESHRPLFVKVGDAVFVHGGILPKHVAYGLDRMNDEVDAWLRGERASPPEVVVAEDGPVWTRAYSAEDHAPACATLKEALAAMGAKTMVVGHTVQRAGINPACDGAVYRIDVGLSRFYGGPIQALELRGGAARVLREP
ncbi:MAG TPA: metallophosphoesterase, partial [Byssovorax sp.]